jgi:uncharacterized protein (TIGR03086 family)
MRTGQELLESAVSYALAGAALATPQFLPRPTPCARWDLETLLDHLSDSIGVLGEAIATGGISPGPAPGYGGPGRDPVGRLRGQAVRLLGTCAAAGPTGRRVAIGDRGLTASMVAVTGAIEITVHGWDIFVACGPAPAGPAGAGGRLAADRPAADHSRHPAGAVRRPGPAARPSRPGDKLIAFLGRRPCLRAAPRPATAQAGHPAQPGAAIPPNPAGLYQ